MSIACLNVRGIPSNKSSIRIPIALGSSVCRYLVSKTLASNLVEKRNPKLSSVSEMTKRNKSSADAITSVHAWKNSTTSFKTHSLFSKVSSYLHRSSKRYWPRYSWVTLAKRQEALWWFVMFWHPYHSATEELVRIFIQTLYKNFPSIHIGDLFIKSNSWWDVH